MAAHRCGLSKYKIALTVNGTSNAHFNDALVLYLLGWFISQQSFALVGQKIQHVSFFALFS
jgi:hypothetical protein